MTAQSTRCRPRSTKRPPGPASSRLARLDGTGRWTTSGLTVPTLVPNALCGICWTGTFGDQAGGPEMCGIAGFVDASGRAATAELEAIAQSMAVADWGLPGALQRLNGMFAFALWDRQERRLHLVRDRLGEKPLYYGWVDQTFLFGSELKALRAHRAFRGEIDRGAMTLYLRHNCIPAPYSIYRGVRKLPPATWVTLNPVDVGSLPAPVPDWSVRQAAERGLAEPFTGSASEATAQLDDLLRDAVRLR